MFILVFLSLPNLNRIAPNKHRVSLSANLSLPQQRIIFYFKPQCIQSLTAVWRLDKIYPSFCDGSFNH